MNNHFKTLIDTFSWTKLIILQERGWKNLLNDILENNSIFITHEVKEEFEYRHVLYKHILKKTTILPLIKIDYKYYIKLGFDQADASLIEYSQKIKIPVITEDHPMLAEGSVNHLEFIQLADFFHIMYRLDQITKNDFYKFLKSLREMRNITKKKFKKLVGHLNDYS